MTDSTADQARQGLGASIAGKAKEVAGAVFGNDSLAAEGRLQQAEATARKEASLKEAVAHAEASEAGAVLAREQEAAADQREVAESLAEARIDRVLDDADQQALSVEVAAEREKAVAQARVDAEASLEQQQAASRAAQEKADADRLEREAAQRYAAEQASAAAAEQAAERARADAERLAAQTH